MKNTNTGKIDVEKLDKVAGGEEAMIIPPLKNQIILELGNKNITNDATGIIDSFDLVGVVDPFNGVSHIDPFNAVGIIDSIDSEASFYI